ncbi:MAG: HAMP domain-containing protein, partial [Desulfomonilaceae bacterium]
MSHVAVVTLAALFLGYFSVVEFNEFQFATQTESLKNQAQLLRDVLKPKFSVSESSSISEWLKKFGAEGGLRITLLAPDGKVLGDSESDPERMENHSNRPEVVAAMAGIVGTSVRYSFTVNRDMVYVAIPVMDQGTLIGIIRTSTSTQRSSHILDGFYFRLIAVIMLLVTAAAILSLILAHRISSPLYEIKETAVKIAQGVLNQKVSSEGPAELVELGNALNEMVDKLRERLNIMTRERNELESLLGEMVEAVIVVDKKKRIVRMNQTAESIFQAHFVQANGKEIIEAIRNRSLNQFVTRTLASPSPIEEELTVIGNPDKILQAHGTQISDLQGKPSGALIVLNDISRLKNIDQIRK